MQLCCMMIAGFKTEEIAAIWMQSMNSFPLTWSKNCQKINLYVYKNCFIVLLIGHYIL